MGNRLIIIQLNNLIELYSYIYIIIPTVTISISGIRIDLGFIDPIVLLERKNASYNSVKIEKRIILFYSFINEPRNTIIKRHARNK